MKATGNAPILKTKKWMVEKEKTVASINDFLRKLLKLESTDTLVKIYKLLTIAENLLMSFLSVGID